MICALTAVSRKCVAVARALAGGCARSAADLDHSLGMNRLLVSAGLALIILGLLWSRIKRLPLFHLPGDIVIDRPGFRVFFPDHDNVAQQRGDFVPRVGAAQVNTESFEPQAGRESQLPFCRERG
jgi:hypothetical protein